MSPAHKNFFTSPSPPTSPLSPPCYPLSFSLSYTQQQQQSSSALCSSNNNNDDDDDETANNSLPKNWLQDLKDQADENAGRLAKPPAGAGGEEQETLLPDGDEGPGNVNIPSTGVSVTDSLVESQKDTFKTSLHRVLGVPGVARIETESGSDSGGGMEPVRYLVALSPPPKEASKGDQDDDAAGSTATEEESTTTSPTHSHLPEKYALVDVPPYSDKLTEQMRAFMGDSATLSTILVTNRDSLHYDESPAVYVTRKSDLAKWKVAFPGARIVMYRLDIPRDCRDIVSQRIDGYGPLALDEGSDGLNATFTETGRPLTVMEWDEDTRRRVMDEGEDPPDDEEELSSADDDELYTPQAIRKREEGKRILAIYTPGRTFGSVSYVFPDVGVCCSGFSVPIEDNRARENLGISAGPRLDYTGYITTNVAGVKRQVESARHLVSRYSDRFTTVLPANGEIVTLGGDARTRADTLFDILDQYEKVGNIYDELGIM